MPEGAVYVGRPGRWGNPLVVDGRRITTVQGGELWGGFPTERAAAEHAVRAFRWQIENHPNVAGFDAGDIRAELAGCDLACWCPLDQPCHADVLLEIANGGRS